MLLAMVGGMFRLGILGVMNMAGIPDAAVRIVVPVIVTVVIPIVLLPLVVRMALYKEYKGFELKVSHSVGGEELTYGESARISWLLGWRVILGVFAFAAALSLFLPTESAEQVLDGSVEASGSPLYKYLPLMLPVWVIFGLLPLGVHAMLKKRFRGFTVAVNRSDDPSLKDLASQLRNS